MVSDVDARDRIKQLEAELEALRASAASDTAGPQPATGSSIPDYMESYPWMYYRRPKGPGQLSEWIIYGPGGIAPSGARNVGAYLDYRRKGFEPLDMYPSIPPPAGPDMSPMFLPLLRAGGAKEFPLSQILAMRWHLRPPIPGLKFPQVEAVADALQHAECPSCEYEEWAGPDDTEIGSRFFNHLYAVHEYSVERAEEACMDQGFANVRRALATAVERERNLKAAKLQQRRRRGDPPEEGSTKEV